MVASWAARIQKANPFAMWTRIFGATGRIKIGQQGRARTLQFGFVQPSLLVGSLTISPTRSDEGGVQHSDRRPQRRPQFAGRTCALRAISVGNVVGPPSGGMHVEIGFVYSITIANAACANATSLAMGRSDSAGLW